MRLYKDIAEEYGIMPFILHFVSCYVVAVLVYNIALL